MPTTLFDSLPGLACLLDEAGCIVRASAGFRDLFADRTPTLAQPAIWQWLTESSSQRLRGGLADVFSKRTTRIQLEIGLKRVGAELGADFVGTLVEFEGEPHLLASLSLQPGLEAPTASRVRSEAVRRKLLDATTDALFIHDSKGAVVAVNEQTCQMFGGPREAFLGDSADRFSLGEAPYSEKEALEKVRLAVEQGPQRFEWRSRRLNGECFWSEVSLRTLDADGEMLIVAFVQDISQRKDAEVALRASESRFRQLFDCSPDAIYVHDHQGRILDANQTASTSLGYSHEELLQLRVPDIVASADTELLERTWRTVEAHGNLTVESSHLRKDGSHFPVDVHVSPFIQNGQRLFFASARDCSERRKAEEERQRLQEHLRQAKRLESIGRLAGGIAHDFNNLLTAILGNLELVKEWGLPAPNRELILDVEKAARSAASLTRQLLTFSRKQVIEPKLLSLNQMIRSLRPMLTRLLGERYQLGLELTEELGAVVADEAQLQQMLVNLCVNARDALPEGGEIRITTENATLSKGAASPSGPAPGDYVMFMVSDAGVGMSDEVKANLFEPFFTTKAMGQGTGLGMATTYGAVQQHGGFIEVDSSPGEGSSIRIYLPRVEATPAKAATDPPEEIPRGKERIYLVEDEDFVRNLAVRILSRGGYEVRAFANGAEALAALEQDNPKTIDLLLTDMVMPQMNGRELAERFEKLRPGVRVLYTSGYSHDVAGAQGMLNPELEFIAKPYSVKVLLARVREILDAGKMEP